MKKTVFIFLLFSLSANSFSDKDSVALNDTITYFGDFVYSDIQIAENGIRSISKLNKVQNSPFFKSKCYSILGEIYLLKANYDSVQLYLNKALEIREMYNYSLYASSTHELLARMYGAIDEDSTALYHIHKSLAVKEKIDNKNYLKSLYTNLGNFHLSLSNYDSSQFYLQKATEIYENQLDTSGIATSYNNLANLFYEKDNITKAVQYYKKSYNYYNLTNELNQIVIPLINIGVCYYEMGKNDSALYYYNHAADFSKQVGNSEYLDYVYLSLAETYTQLNQPDSAIAMFQQYITYRDSIFSQDKVNAILQAETKYQTKQAKQQVLLEQEKNATIKAQDQNKRKTIYILIAIIAIIGLIILFLIRNARQKSKLNTQAVDIKNQEIDNLLKEQEAKSYAALLEGQNTERKRIAQDLHDRLGGTLAAVKIHFSLMDQKIENLQTENRDLFDKVNGMLSEAVQDVRRISHDLASGRLSKLGLKGALEDLTTILNTTKKLEVDFYMDENLPAFEEKKEQEIYAIVQELVSNTLKHAQATEVELQLNLQDEELNILFEDNGVGFVMNKAITKGLGITGLNNRVNKLNGSINYDSVIGRGTIVIINIPL